MFSSSLKTGIRTEIISLTVRAMDDTDPKKNAMFLNAPPLIEKFVLLLYPSKGEVKDFITILFLRDNYKNEIKSFRKDY